MFGGSIIVGLLACLVTRHQWKDKPWEAGLCCQVLCLNTFHWVPTWKLWYLCVFNFYFYFYRFCFYYEAVLEKAMAPHSSTLAWKIPWMEEPGRLQFLGWLRVGHDWVTSLSLFTFMHWRRKWQPTAVSLPGESQGRGSLVGCRLWGRTESATTEATQQQQHEAVYFLFYY